MLDFEGDDNIQINIFNPKDTYKKKIALQKKNTANKPKLSIKKNVSLKKKNESTKVTVVNTEKDITSTNTKLQIVKPKVVSGESKSGSFRPESFKEDVTSSKTKSENISMNDKQTNKTNKGEKENKFNKNKGKIETNIHKNKKKPFNKNVETTQNNPTKIVFSTNLERKVMKRKSVGKKEDEQLSKKFKPSVIYNSDMQTPNIQKLEVVPMNENVFSEKNFSCLHLHPFMVSNLLGMGVEWMTEVQQKTIPSIIQGKDILVKSQTGSGKTLTYGIPVVNTLQSIEPKIKRTDGPYCIVVVPTRELVMQTYIVINKLVKPFVWVVPGYLMGGENRKSEKSRLKKGMNVIVATPGRLIDHLDNTCSLNLQHVRYLVVDEADRMFEMGFEKDVSKVVMLVQKKCLSPFQTILLSATLSPGVEKLAGMSLNEPLKVDIVNKNFGMNKNNTNNSTTTNNTTTNNTTTTTQCFSTPTNLKHHFVVVPTKLRLVTLATMLLWKCQLSAKACKAIVFLSTQDAVEFHHSLLDIALFSPGDDDVEDDDDDSDGGGGDDDDGGGDDDVSGGGSDDGDGGFGGKKAPTRLFKLYGDLDQKERMKIFAEFHKAKSGVLLSTDVAARGLDLPDIDWILQYNTPGTPTDYIHRVGRTARIGCHGNALIFLAPSETEYVKVLAEHRIAVKEIKMEDILAKLLIEVQLGKIDLTHKGNVPRTVQDAASSLQTRLESTMVHDQHLRSLARKAYQSFIRAYATYPSHLKHIFHIKHLHLGHLATSFALSESPSDTSKVVKKFRKKDSARGRGGRSSSGRGGSSRGGSSSSSRGGRSSRGGSSSSGRGGGRGRGGKIFRRG